MGIVAEEWRAIEGMEGYEASNLGSVRSIDRVKVNSRGIVRRLSGRVLRLTNHPQGYLTVRFFGKIPQLVHRIVAVAWLGPIPDGHEVNHIDGNKKNNAASNLEYVTRRGNMKHARETGLWDNRGEKNGQAKATEEKIRVACALMTGGMMQTEAASRVGISSNTLSTARRGVKWAHLNIGGKRLTCPNKIPDSVRAEVRRLGAMGLSQSQIIKRTGVGNGSVHRILHPTGGVP